MPDLSRIESGKLTLESAPLDLDALLHDSVALMAERARVRALELSVALDPRTPGSPAHPHHRDDRKRIR